MSLPLTSPEVVAVSRDSMTSPSSVFDASVPDCDTTADSFGDPETAQRIGNNTHPHRDDAEKPTGLDSPASSCRDTDTYSLSKSYCIPVVEPYTEESEDRRREDESETLQRQSSAAVEDSTSGQTCRDVRRRGAEVVDNESRECGLDVALAVWSSQSETGNRLDDQRRRSEEQKIEGDVF